MGLEELGYFLLASILLTLSPGADILYLLSKSLASGAKYGIVLAAGLCSGLVVHTALVALGVAALIKESAFLLAALRYVGASYLLYLAWQSYEGENELRLSAEDIKEPLDQLYWRGVLMNVLNPKVILFFLAFLPQFIQAGNDNIFWQIVFLGLIFGVQAFCLFTCVAFMAGKIRKHVISSSTLGRRMGYVQSIVLVCISLALLQ